MCTSANSQMLLCTWWVEKSWCQLDLPFFTALPLPLGHIKQSKPNLGVYEDVHTGVLCILLPYFAICSPAHVGAPGIQGDETVKFTVLRMPPGLGIFLPLPSPLLLAKGIQELCTPSCGFFLVPTGGQDTSTCCPSSLLHHRFSAKVILK